MLPGRLFASLALAVATVPAIAVGGVHANVYKLPSSTSTSAQPVSIAVDTSAAIGITHPNFVSFSFDTTALFGIQRTLIPFGDTVLQQLARNLAPSYLRFGGSLQDHVIMNVTGDIPTSGIPGPSDFIQLYMNTSMWDSMIDFCSSAGLDLVYGLNAAIGRQTSTPATWNFTNVELLLKYIASKNQSVPVVELGNESNVYNCSGSSANISASQIYGQYAMLRSTLKSLLPSTQVWGLDPSVTGDVKGQCHSWYGDDLFGYYRDFLALNNGTAVDSGVDRSSARERSMLRSGATASAAFPTTADLDLEAAATAAATMIDAVTWHYYPQVQSNVTSGIAQILSYEYQTRIQAYSNQAIASRDQFVSSLPIIMGETSSYWAGGLANVSNRYASGFWYLNQLGYLAATGYSVMIRQDLAGGDYGLLDLICNATAPAHAEVPLGDLHYQPDAQVLGHHHHQQQVQAQAQVQVDCNTNDTGVVVGYRPNPDYFTTALWKQLVGTRVLGVSDGYLVDNGSDASQQHEKRRRGSGDSDVDTSVGGDGGDAAASTSSSSASSSGVRVWAFCALPSSITNSESTRDDTTNRKTASSQVGGQTDTGSSTGDGSINASGDTTAGVYSAGDVVLVISNLNDYNVSIDLNLVATRTTTSSPEGGSHIPQQQRHPAPPQSTPTSVDLYILTPPPGEGLDSGLVCLNGNPAPLALCGVNRTSLPPFPPVSLPWTTDVRSSSSSSTGVKERGDKYQKQHEVHQQQVQQPVITWPAQSYGFLVIKGASAAACTATA